MTPRDGADVGAAVGRDAGVDGAGPRLTRRQVLAAAGFVGGVSALGGGRTVAYLTDNDAAANRLTAGSLDLGVCWEPADSTADCQPEPGDGLTLDLEDLHVGARGAGTIRLTLPDDGSNNPAWVWLRTACPVAECDLSRAVRVSLWYDIDCDGQVDAGRALRVPGGEPLMDVSLCRALTELSNGVLLDPSPGDGTEEPLEPGDSLCIGVTWTVSRAVCGAGSASLDLEFLAEQYRHNPEPRVPWAPRECTVDCSVECESECYPASFIAFCLAERDAIQPSDITSLQWTDDTISFVSQRDLDVVTLYYGPPTFETFTRKGGFPAGLPHQIVRGEGTVMPAAEAKDRFGQAPKDPCPDLASDGCGVKYNFDPAPDDGGEYDTEGHWECVCGPPGPGRQCTGGDDA